VVMFELFLASVACVIACSIVSFCAGVSSERKRIERALVKLSQGYRCGAQCYREQVRR
jgi:hypothetical protein